MNLFSIKDLELLYKKYSSDLLEDRKLLREYYNVTGGMMNDTEAEIMYMFVRETMPHFLVEIGCCNGWSTAWILSATKRNKRGYTVSYDWHEGAVKPIRKFFPEQSEPAVPWWQHVAGNAMTKDFMNGIDFILIDADHSNEFAKWYIKEVFPKVKSGACVCVHDIFPHAYFGEDDVILGWLKEHNVPFFTCAYTQEPEICNGILKLRESLGFGKVSKIYIPSCEGDIHDKMSFNSMIYFGMP